MKRDSMLININEWIENQHLFENMSSTGARVWFIMIIAVWQPLPISEKPLFHVASLWEGLNWLLEEVRMNREGGFRPTCRYVFDYHPGIGVNSNNSFCVYVLRFPCFGWLAEAIAVACLSKPCCTYFYPSKFSPFFQPSVSLLPNLVPSSLATTHFAAVSDCLGS